MTPEEKKAYNRAYYQEYKKKGLKKGRKKSSKKKTSSKKGKKGKSETLLGLSNSGLNDAGKMQWAMEKDNLSKQMNAELAKAKTPEERARIKQDYQNKALAALQKIKSDPKMAKAKKEKAAKASKGSSGNKGSSGGKESTKESSKSKKDDDEDEEESTAKSSKSSKSTAAQGGTSKGTTTSRSAVSTSAAEPVLDESEEPLNDEQISNIKDRIETLREQIADMPPETREMVKARVSDMITELKKRLGYGQGAAGN